MELTELRIGNLVYEQSINSTIREVYSHKIVSDDFKLTNFFEPIPLTEEWSLKCGFKKKDNSAWFELKLPDPDGFGSETYFSFCQGILIIHQINTQGMTIQQIAELQKEINPTPKDSAFDTIYNTFIPFVKIEYLHQLQNFYFDLTHEELKIN